jgi:hypothetical protein
MRGDFCIGVDLGQSNDYTALAIVEKLHSGNLQKLTALHLRHLERYPLLTPYPEIADKVVALAQSEYLVTYTTDEMLNRITLYPELVVDQTGVGVAVTDLLKERELKFTAVTIHGGERVTRSKGAYNVPKLDLVAALEDPFYTSFAQFMQILYTNFVQIIDLEAHNEYTGFGESRQTEATETPRATAVVGRRPG